MQAQPLYLLVCSMAKLETIFFLFPSIEKLRYTLNWLHDDKSISQDLIIPKMFIININLQGYKIRK